MKPSLHRAYKGMKIHRIGALSYATLISLLMRGDSSTEELAEETGLHLNTVRNYLAALRKLKVIYISEWRYDRVNHPSLRIFKLGGKQDATRPVAPRGAACKRYRESQKLRKQQIALTLKPYTESIGAHSTIEAIN